MNLLRPHNLALQGPFLSGASEQQSAQFTRSRFLPADASAAMRVHTYVQGKQNQSLYASRFETELRTSKCIFNVLGERRPKWHTLKLIYIFVSFGQGESWLSPRQQINIVENKSELINEIYYRTIYFFFYYENIYFWLLTGEFRYYAESDFSGSHERLLPWIYYKN